MLVSLDQAQALDALHSEIYEPTMGILRSVERSWSRVEVDLRRYQVITQCHASSLRNLVYGIACMLHFAARINFTSLDSIQFTHTTWFQR